MKRQKVSAMAYLFRVSANTDPPLKALFPTALPESGPRYLTQEERVKSNIIQLTGSDAPQFRNARSHQDR
jgi:hypothetical protein